MTSAGSDATVGQPGGTRSAAIREWVGMAVVGGASVIVDFGVFNALLVVGANPAIANLTALVVATLVAFLANFRWTFAHRDVANPRKALVLFFLVNLVSAAGVQVAVMVAAAISLDVAWLNGVKLAATVLATVARFWLYRSLVYR